MADTLLDEVNKKDERYQSIKLNDANIDIEHNRIDEDFIKKIAEDGTQAFGDKSNCGSKAIFSFVCDIEHISHLRNSKEMLVDLLTDPLTFPFSLTIMRFQEQDKIKSNNGTVFKILDIKYSGRSTSQNLDSLLEIVFEMKKETARTNVEENDTNTQEQYAFERVRT